ncbi:hypothetical protein QYE76_067364 [Lolium multiflorum]|uniref:Transposase (putative) gypsy type domain-containing protein n=1 Tax=Lolium multiflorum TaxID=4521 RepID=A0AAD8SCP4_LOLMU|nr:hypothetical protein QYE76_067364 [Lolium multiflorum]
MAPRSKQCKNHAPGTEERMEKAKISGWERSKFSVQDMKMLKKMGLLNKEAMKMPGDESSPHPPIDFRVIFVDFLIRGLSVPVHEFLRGLLLIYGIQLDQLTPNSLLHISIFITLCECFLGIHPHWGLWKRIFYLRRNNSKNVIYNVGGVCICVHPEVEYFDVKFADSVQGWRRKWLYINDESSNSQEYGLAPFDAAEDIQRRKSWDAEATAEKKAATHAFIARIQELQNTDGAELSDTDRVSDNLPLKYLEKLVRCFTSLSKNHEVPSSCRVEPFSGSHALPKNHQSLSSLPPLPEGGEVDERAIVTDDSQESSVPESEPVGSQRTVGSSDRDLESDQHSDSTHSVSTPHVASPDKRKRKRDDDKDSDASKLAEPAAEESSPKDQEVFDPYTMTCAVSSADKEEEEPEAHEPAPTSTSNTLVLSEDHHELVNLGSQFIGFCDKVATLREALRRAEEHAEDLEVKLKASEEARKRVEKDVADVKDLRQRLQAAEDALSDKEAKQVEHENEISTRLEMQSRRFSRKMGEQYTLSQESDDSLLDTLDILELNCDLACKCITSVRNVLKRVFPHFFPKDTQPEIFSQLAQHFLAHDDPALAYRQARLKIGVKGIIVLVATSGQKVDWVKAGAPKLLNSEKWKALVKDAKAYSKKLIVFLDPKSSSFASAARTEVK